MFARKRTGRGSPRPRHLRGALSLALLWSAGPIACSPQASSASRLQQSEAPTSSDVPAVLATVGGEKITMEQIRSEAGEDLDRMDFAYAQARHKLIEATLQKLLRERLFEAEARKRGKSVDQLVAAEAGGSLDPSEAEISTWFEENQDRVGGRSLAQVHDAIAEFLHRQKQEAAMQTLQERLQREADVTVNLGPYRVRFDNAEAPARGGAEAPVTIVEFSDFQCPFCGRFYSTLKQVEQRFGDTVQVVYRQFPLTSIHPYAQKAAEASLCAKAQGKFWQMHDAMFEDQAHLAVADLKEKAARLGLDRTRFDACLDSGRYVDRIEKDEEEGRRVGVSGTPALFVNGIPLEGGAVPYDVVADAIREELRRGGR